VVVVDNGSHLIEFALVGFELVDAIEAVAYCGVRSTEGDNLLAGFATLLVDLGCFLVLHAYSILYWRGECTEQTPIPVKVF